MTEMLSKFPYYDILNTIVPGVVFYFFWEQGDWSFNASNGFEIVGAIVFFGLTASRIGSFIEGLCLKIHLITRESYKDYVEASQTDAKIDILCRQRNLYRSIVGSVVLYFLMSLLFYFQCSYSVLASLVLLLYGAAYFKQNKYVFKRVRIAIEDDRDK